jgi:hypothetical protein
MLLLWLRLLLPLVVPLSRSVAVADVTQGPQTLLLLLLLQLLQGAVQSTLPLAHIILITAVCCSPSPTSSCSASCTPVELLLPALPLLV